MAKLFRFGLVGGIVAAFDFGFIWAFSGFVPRLAAVAIAYLLAVALHFCLNRWWVFAALHRPAAAQLPRYALTVSLCWLSTVTITALALSTLTTNVFLAKAGSIPPTTLLGFVLMRSFVFRHPPSSGGG
jgi:putative flippase GtrA